MKERENFLDKSSIIALILVGLCWLGWDAYMRKKYPAPPATKTGTKKSLITESLSPASAKNSKTFKQSKTFTPKPLEVESKTPILKEQVFAFQSEGLFLEISSQGMGFKKVLLNQILDRKGQKIELFSGDKDLPFETRILNTSKPLHFEIKQTSPLLYEGVAKFKDLKVIKTLTIEPEQFLVKTKVKVTGDLSLVSGLKTLITQTQKAFRPDKNFLSFLTPPDIDGFFVSSNKGFEQIPLPPGKTPNLEQSYSSVKIAALGTKYFGQAWIEEKSDVLPQFHITFKNEQPLGFVQHLILNPNKDFELSYKMFMGPKDFTLLKKHSFLFHWVDFGWFGALSRFILSILEFFYSLAGNWGGSIILLTLLVRLSLLPLALSSHRSMETMKKVHPEIQKIREKFKKDPQRLNQEVMALMKTHRANPFGGCLILLLQIPVFWALWRALSNSYALYQAPFMLWIQDLSWKDPYYVLPVLMSFFMFLQQKIQPVAAMSKEMTRIMMIMPIVMGVFMINLPSGLALYMLVSAVFGMAQQALLNKKSETLAVIDQKIKKPLKEVKT